MLKITDHGEANAVGRRICPLHLLQYLSRGVPPTQGVRKRTHVYQTTSPLNRTAISEVQVTPNQLGPA